MKKKCVSGEELTEQLKLRPLLSGYDKSYNKEIDAGVSNEFSTAAYRFGHSMLQVLYICNNRERPRINDNIPLNIKMKTLAGPSGVSRSART